MKKYYSIILISLRFAVFIPLTSYHHINITKKFIIFKISILSQKPQHYYRYIMRTHKIIIKNPLTTHFFFAKWGFWSHSNLLFYQYQHQGYKSRYYTRCLNMSGQNFIFTKSALSLIFVYTNGCQRVYTLFIEIKFFKVHTLIFII